MQNGPNGGICSKNVEKAPCGAIVGPFLAVVGPLSSHCRALVGPSLGHRRAIVGPLSGHCQAIVGPRRTPVCFRIDAEGSILPLNQCKKPLAIAFHPIGWDVICSSSRCRTRQFASEAMQNGAICPKIDAERSNLPPNR